MRRITMNTKFLNITGYGLAAGLLAGTLALGGASAAPALARPVPAPTPAHVAAIVWHPGPCAGCKRVT
jgi:hypothetical protein